MCIRDRTTTSPRAERPGSGQADRSPRGDRKGPRSIDEVFKMDTNNDGKLSKSEVKGKMLERFPKIDTNGDGFISREEFTNAPRPKRGQRPPKG